MKFKVHLIDENPFRVPFPRMGSIIIEAKDEEEVKTFWKDAKKRNIQNVRGLNLGKIEKIDTDPKRR